MVVCKFFQQGNCRYGQNCRFDHIYGSKYSYHAPHSGNSESAPSGVTDEQLINQVQTDVQAVLKGRQWLLSGYSPFKEKPNFPGLLDLSMEEARLFIYEAKANNNLDQAMAHYNKVVAENKYKYEQLLQPNASITRVLRSLYKGESVASPFGSNAAGAFGSSSAASSIFRSALQSSNTFGQSSTTASSSIFGPSTTNSVFGQSSVQSTNTPSVFNLNQAPSGANDPKSIFAQASQNVFGQNQPASNGFGQSQPTNNSIFGQNPVQSTNVPSVFNLAPSGASDPKSIFAQASHNVFGQNQPTTNVFAQNQPTTNVFAQNQPTTNNVFAQSQPTTNNVFGISTGNQQTNISESIYSDMKDLSPNDLEAFGADDFKLGFIPEIPPPRQLCF